MRQHIPYDAIVESGSRGTGGLHLRLKTGRTPFLDEQDQGEWISTA